MAKLKKIKREGKWKYFVDGVEVGSSAYHKAYANNRGYKNIYKLATSNNYKTFRGEKLECRMKEEYENLPDGFVEIPSVPNYYVNREGNVWSYSNKRKRYIKITAYSNPNNNNYCSIQPYIDGKRYVKYVHRLVAETFLGAIPLGYEIHHKDYNVTNNNISNLEYVSAPDHRRHKKLGRANKKQYI